MIVRMHGENLKLKSIYLLPPQKKILPQFHNERSASCVLFPNKPVKLDLKLAVHMTSGGELNWLAVSLKQSNH